jgi:membrane dipeptidase
MKKITTIIILLFSFLNVSYSQQIYLYGFILDKISGQAIPYAIVEILDITTGKRYTTQSGMNGTWTTTISRVHQEDKMPLQFALEQNYPNPFNPSTKIGFSTVKEGNVSIKVFNSLGQELDKKSFYLQPGYYSIDWYSKGSTSVLFYSIETNGTKLTKKMVQIDGGNGGLGGLSSLGNPSNNRTADKLQKISAHDFKISASKLGYYPDSSNTTVESSDNVNFMLESVHNRSFFIDLHNDLLENTVGINYNWGDLHTTKQTDIPRMMLGGLDAQMFVVWVDPRIPGAPGFYNKSLSLIATFNQQIALNSTKIAQAKNENDIININSQNKIAAILAVEGGHAIEDDISKLINFYNLGARYLTLTWNSGTSWAVSHSDYDNTLTKGLTEFGKQVIKTLDSLGMLIDVSHVGVKTIEDVLALTRNPIIASHSNAYSLWGNTRNLTDNQIRAIANNGGVIGINFYPSFLAPSGRNAILDSVVHHIDYIKKLVGIDYIAIGADFDGMGSPVPSDIFDVSRFPDVTMALLKKGYTIPEVKKILGENFMRVFRKVCK